MEIDRQKVLEILKVQMRRAESERGMQPELTLGCFYGQNRRDTDFCEKCKNYEGCYLILRTCIVERKPFERGL